MLVTVVGARSTKELRDLVKALVDRCQLYAYTDLAAVVKAVAAQHGITVPGEQVDQVLYAMAAAQPAVSGPSPARRLIAETTNNPVRLAEMLESAWMWLAAESSAELEAADHARAFETRYQRLTLPGWCFLLMHDVDSGRPILPDRAISATVAAGVLAELILAGRIDAYEPDDPLRAYTDAEYHEAARIAHLISRLPEGADDSVLRFRARWLPPVRNSLPEISAAATHALIRFKDESRTMRLDAWFRQLLPGSADAVRDDLVGAGVVRARRVRRGLRERIYFPPTDSFEVVLLRGSITGPLTRGAELAERLALALELARSCGLTRARPDDWLGAKTLPARTELGPIHFRPVFERLLDLVEEAVDAAVYSPS
jgi:hypothetical protein